MYKPSFILRTYQETGLKFLKDNPFAYLAFPMGLGKTIVTLSYLKYLIESKMTRGIIIVAPLRVARLVWPAEIEAWDQFKNIHFDLLHGKGKEAKFFNGSPILIINYEGLPWLYTMIKNSKFCPFDTIIFDEGSKLKSFSLTKRIKIVRAIVPLTKRRVILSGTPMPNSHMDLFNQIRTLDEGKRLGKNMGTFKINHFDQLDYLGYRWKVKKGHDKIIEDKIKDIFLHIPAEGNVKSHGVTVEDIELVLPPEGAVAYKKMEKTLFAEIGEDKINAVNTASKVNKCLQIVSGSVYDENKKVVKVHDGKMKALKTFLSQHKDSGVLIFYKFKHEADRLRKEIKGIKFIGGDVSQNEEKNNIDLWNDGKIKVLAAHPLSCGHGLNLQKGGHYALWFTLTYSLEEYDQACARIDRSGQQNHVTIYRFITKNTVEEVISSVLDRRSKSQVDFLEALKFYRREK